MELEEIETFLTAVDAGSISKAGELLYVSQVTASNRIRSLEEKLGYTLFYRCKGQRTLEITPKGACFIPIAKQWMNLWQEANQIGNALLCEEITISAADTMNRILFFPFYKIFTERYPQYYLAIKTYHSSETYHRIDTQLCDIGFTVNLYDYPSVDAKLFYQEPMMLILHKHHPYVKSRKLSDLNLNGEIYLPHFNEYVAWHKRIFNRQDHPFITVATSLMQYDFLINENHWCIMPEHLAKYTVGQKPDFVMCPLIKEAVPKRNVYILYNRHLRTQKREKIQKIVQEMIHYFNDDENFKLVDFDILNHN